MPIALLTLQVEKLANFLAQDKEVQQYSMRWAGPEESSHALLGLAAYDSWKGSFWISVRSNTELGNANPSLTLNVTSSTSSLLSSSFKSISDPPAYSTFFFENIRDPDNIQFKAIGTCVHILLQISRIWSGEASVVFGATFVPLEVSKDPINRGISVNKVVQILDEATGESVGGAIASAKIGQQGELWSRIFSNNDLVKVTLEISLPDYASRIDIIDPLPGCLEALDDSFFDVPQNAGSWNRRWWWYYY